MLFVAKKGRDPQNKLEKKEMAVLTAAKRKKLKPSQFGIPKKRGPRGGVESSYPMPDLPHAKNAKARAVQQYKKGSLSESEALKIIRMANRKIKASGGTVSSASMALKGVQKKKYS